MQIARGLAAAHASGIIHRDLKPENLFLTRDGRAKILDFGVAKLVGAAQSETHTMNTGAGVVVGTAGYMAPEQVRADPVDPRTDIFALGLVMHEMLCGARPFQRDTMPETLAAILKDDAPERRDRATGRLTKALPMNPSAPVIKRSCLTSLAIRRQYSRSGKIGRP